MDRKYLLAIIAALAVLLICSVGLNAWQWRSAGIARQEYVGNLQLCTDANKRSSRVRDELQRALDACAGQQRDLAAAMTSALTEREALLAKATTAQRQLRHELDGIYANDANCRAWRDQPVCRAVSDRLRAGPPRQ